MDTAKRALPALARAAAGGGAALALRAARARSPAAGPARRPAASRQRAPVGLVVVGGGRMGVIRARAAYGLPSVHLKAVVDLNIDSLPPLYKRFGEQGVEAFS